MEVEDFVEPSPEVAMIDILLSPAIASISGVTERLKYANSSISIVKVEG